MEGVLITTDVPYTYDIFTRDLSRLLITFPQIKKETIGYSVLGKPLYAIKLGCGKKKLIITAAHHGKEWITSMLLNSLIVYFCQEKTDFLKDKTIYFIPMVNPDGVNLCIKGITYDLPPYVKNRLMRMSENGDFIGNWQANIRGIDLNHNYDASFSKGRAIQLERGIYGPCSTMYSGEYPESEPETKAIVEFTKRISPDIVIAYHSQGEEIYYKYQGMCAPDAEDIARKMSDASGYQLILADGLTDCTGYKDWVIEKFNIPAFTVEVGKGENPLPLSQFKKIFDDNLKLILSI